MWLKVSFHSKFLDFSGTRTTENSVFVVNDGDKIVCIQTQTCKGKLCAFHFHSYVLIVFVSFPLALWLPSELAEFSFLTPIVFGSKYTKILSFKYILNFTDNWSLLLLSLLSSPHSRHYQYIGHQTDCLYVSPSSMSDWCVRYFKIYIQYILLYSFPCF